MTEEEARDFERLKDGLVQGAKAGLVKVCFPIESDDWPGVSTEWLWAEPVADRQPLQAVLVNIPGYVDGVSLSDTVLVRQDEEDAPRFFRFAGIAARGGHSTIVVLTPPDSDALIVRWPPFDALGCHCEKGEIETRFGPMMAYALDVPPETDLAAVIALLRQGAKDGVWMFRGTNIEHKPRWPAAREPNS